MKKIAYILLASLLFCILATGCGKKENATSPAVEEMKEEPVGEASNDITDANPSAEESNEDNPNVPPHENMSRSRLTNEWIDDKVAESRPVAVMIPNTKTASQYGLSDASILYECNVEASMTRLMAIFEDWQNMDKIGNIRSCRDYFVYWAFEWDAVVVHYGGPFYINDIISRKDTQNIDCIDYSAACFRDIAKNDYDNAFTSGEAIKKAMDYYGYTTKYREGYADENHYMFAPVDAPNTLEQYDDVLSAAKVDMSLAYPVTNCYFVYNESTGLYDRYQHLARDVDGPHMDLANNKQLSFKNILVQNTYYEVRDQKGYLAFQCHDATRDGWFFTNGKGIHVTWEKGSDYGATRYFDDNGNEIKLNTGKTMICILADGDSFTVDGKVLANCK